ncbi:MAG TPA: M12 family metallo-peptidase [Steroidobacteraceae bacterium]|nr:M12 family metallo-peptidase [Steroidobacteraceae bacterium]
MSTAAAGLVPQHTEDLRPALKRTTNGDAATLDFTAFGRAFRLQLSNNQRLAQFTAGSSLQLYKGTVEGVPGSWARISIHDGLPRGIIWDGREMFVVDAAPEAVNYGAAGTVMFKLSDAVLEQGVSLADDTVETPADAAASYDAMTGELRANAQALQAGAVTEGVQISILGDASYLARFANETQARDAILTRLNNVEGIFSSQVGIELRVESINIAGQLTAGLSATTDASSLLGEVRQLRQQTAALSATGLTHLFTGRELDGNSAGIAYTDALCSKRYAASLTMTHTSVTLDTLITAHEIGHVFGAPHDGTEKCASTPQGQFIMTPTLDTSVTSFSQCSLDEIKAVIGSYACVKALPASEPVPPPAPPAAPPSNDGGGGGGGSLDPSWLMILLALVAARPRQRGNADGPANTLSRAYPDA